MILHTDGIHDKNKMIYGSNKNTQGVGYDMEDFGILWIWGFCGDSHRFFFCGYGMGIGIKIQSPRQPWVLDLLIGTWPVDELSAYI